MPQAGRQAGSSMALAPGCSSRAGTWQGHQTRCSMPCQGSALLLNHHSLLETAVIHQPEEEPHGSACKLAADWLSAA